MSCDYEGCDHPVLFRAYAAYNADEGENVHPLHARYPAPMFRACGSHLGRLMLHDLDGFGSTRQWLIVAPLTYSSSPVGVDASLPGSATDGAVAAGPVAGSTPISPSVSPATGPNPQRKER